MKKTYKNPNMVIVKIATRQMLASSDPYSGAKFNPNESSSTMDSRIFDFDDEE